jgi:4-amino-4-deoxy-L-arabinose transferase-like glycosyltransferase
MKSWLDSLPSPHLSVRRLLVGIAAAVLFCIYAMEVTLSSRALSATWDEPTHIMAGYRYWLAGDYGINPEHPPLAKLVGAFPLLFMHLKVPSIGRDDSKPTVVIRGRELVYRNDADALLLRMRLAEAVVGLLLVLLLFEAGHRMFGAGVAWAAVVLAIFEPNLLAHSTLVTTDFAFTCFYVAAVYALWRVAERPTLLRLAGCGVMSGLALASKHSALLLLPTLALLAAVEVACRANGAGVDVSARRGVVGRDMRIWVGRLIVIYGLAVLVLWGFYGFHYQARPDGLPLWQSVSTYTQVLKGHFEPWLINTAARFRLLPESYLFGLIDVLWITKGPRLTFLLGRLYPHALWYYFPVAFVIKSTLGFLALLVLGVAAIRSWSGEFHRKAAYLLIPPAFFMGVAMTSGTNMGIRHVLPIYPFLILAAAAGAWVLVQRHRAWAIVVAALVALHLASSLHSLPDYLAYSNELFGGTSNTYRNLSDSNVDWGQGLREAGQYLERRNIKDCWLAYFGTADPAYYHLPCRLLPDPFLRWWRDPIEVPPEHYRGVILVSGTQLAAPYWGWYLLNPYSGFLAAKPVANIGGSVLVYEGNADLRSAAVIAHIYKAWDYVESGDQELAIQEALKTEELAPEHPAPPFILGMVLAKAKRTEAARIQFETSLNLAEAIRSEYGQLCVTAAKAQLAILP